MSRRIGLPEAILAEVADRAIYGAGHDGTMTTFRPDGPVSARQACEEPPTPQMLAIVSEIFDHLNARGAIAVSVTSDIQELQQPGCLTVSWSNGPSPSQVAAVFAPTVSDDLPQLPIWLALRSHTEFDLRWAQGWGPAANVDTTDGELVNNVRTLVRQG